MSLGELSRDELHATIRGYMTEGFGLADLHLVDWDRLSAEEKADRIGGLWNWSLSKRWAWDILEEMVKEMGVSGAWINCRDEWCRELRDFAVLVVAGRMPRPRATKDDRDHRICTVYRWLRRNDSSHRKALADVADALGMPEETVRSAYRKMKDYAPFPRSGGK